MRKATVYYVDIHAPVEGNGSRERPFRHINEAAHLALPGDEILVMPGIYREYINPINAGTEEAPIVYRSQEKLGAVITGAEILTGWTKYEKDVWTAQIDNGIFGNYNPYTTFVYGDWYFAPKVRHTGSVFLNDMMMYETVSLEECLAGEPDPYAWKPEESRYKWFSRQEENRTVFYANFRGKDPNQEKVEIDYLKRKDLKKPGGAKPGFVVYYTNYSMAIAPDISSLKLISD